MERLLKDHPSDRITTDSRAPRFPSLADYEVSRAKGILIILAILEPDLEEAFHLKPEPLDVSVAQVWPKRARILGSVKHLPEPRIGDRAKLDPLPGVG